MRAWIGGLFFVLPVVAVFAIFVIYPVAFNVYVSFTNWAGFGRSMTYIGDYNYVTFFTSSVFSYDVVNAVFWVGFYVTLPVFVGLSFAIMLSTKIRGKTFFKAALYYPQVVAGIVAAVWWTFLISPEVGLIPNLLKSLDLSFLTNYIFIFNSHWSANSTYAVIAGWQSVGFSMVVFLAGLASFSPALAESARVDGAGSWGVFRNVTFPMIRPFFVIVVVISLVNAFRMFDIIFALTSGGPFGSTNTFALTMWLQAFEFVHYGLGSAIANVLFVITAICALSYLWYYLRHEKEVFR